MTESSKLPYDDFSRVENGAIAGKYLSLFWQPIALGRDFTPRVAKRIKILGEFYTLYRGEDGSAHMVQDRCPHRGTSLAYGWVEENCIRCRYHGWKFAATGEGVDFPAETATYARSISLKTYPTHEYLGVIFGYFGEGEPPKFPRFPELEDENAGELAQVAVVLPYNYFQRVENDIDEVHIHFTHRDFMGNFGLIDVPRMSAYESEYGVVAVAKRLDGTELYTHEFMPNMMLREVALQQDTSKLTMHAAWRVPIDDVTTLSIMIDRVGHYDEAIRDSEKGMIDPAAIAAQVMAGEMTLEEVDERHPLLPVIQDTVTMAGQGLIADRSAEHLGQSDRAIGLLRKVWTREMAALREGKPLKSWSRPENTPLVFAVQRETVAADAGKPHVESMPHPESVF